MSSETETLRRQIAADITGLQWIVDNTKPTDDSREVLAKLHFHKRAMAMMKITIDADTGKEVA